MTQVRATSAMEQTNGEESRNQSFSSSNGRQELELQPLRQESNVDDNNYVLGEEMEIFTEEDDRTILKDHTASYTRMERLERFLYPAHLPRPCQLLRPENLAIPACYLLVGLLQGFSSPIIGVLPLDLSATEAQQTTFLAIRGLPASFKILFGFISDNFPIAGYRRKPYMFTGWLLASLSLAMLMTFSNLDVAGHGSSCFAGQSDDGSQSKQIPDDAPSIPFLAVSVLLFGIGFWMADVMGDSIVAEKAKLEPLASRGSIQSSCYSYRFFGVMVASPLSTYVYSAYGPLYVILILALLPLCILPLVYIMKEASDIPIRSTPEQCLEIWNTVCSRAAWQPMGFVFLYNLLQVGNGAWKEFTRTVLGFTSCQINLIANVAYVLLFVGILSYKYYFIRYSWRTVYIWTTALNGLFSVFQILLIYGITFGLPNFWFALGDDAMFEFISGIQFLPTTILMVHLCPDGSEGASYAMFTTMNNAALGVSNSLSTFLLGVWDTDKETLAKGNLSGLAKLTYLTTAIQMVGVLFVGWLPHNHEGLAELASKGRSEVGGAAFLTILFLALGYAISVGVMNIVFPGWMGES